MTMLAKKPASFLFLATLGLPFLAYDCRGLSHSDSSRRHVLKTAASQVLVSAGLSSLSLWHPPTALAVDEEDEKSAPTSAPVVAAKKVLEKKTVSKDKTVLVLGANGQTGRECVAAALASGRPCVATTRSGTFGYADEISSSVNNNKLSTAAIDVTQAAIVQTVIAEQAPNLGAVIFAASASTKGGDAFAVDQQGVINVAQACIANNVPRLVIVSSGTVTRPDSAVYKLLNTVGKGIMQAKIQGEDAVRALYADPTVRVQNLGYTVVRPGGLTMGESLGPSALELNQGDTKSGRLSRADVAAICVNALDSETTWDTTFECYEALTAKPIESVGLSNILKLKGESTFVSGKERRGSTWAALFDGLQVDVA